MRGSVVDGRSRGSRKGEGEEAVDEHGESKAGELEDESEVCD